MRNKTSGIRYALYLVFVGWSVCAFGQTVQFQITSVQPNNLGGVYTDPYNAIVNPGANNAISLPAFCDDFSDNVTPPQTWTALQTNLSAFTGGSNTVGSVYYGGGMIAGTTYTQTQEYIAAAILATESLPLYQTDSADANDLSFALWGIFDPSLLFSYQQSCITGSEGCLSVQDQTKAKADLANALAMALNYSNGSDFEATGYNVEIYTAYDSTAPNGVSKSPTRPQEFITVVRVSEASAPAQLAVELSGLAAVAWFFRRRRVDRVF